ncbi:MAG: hypothetical protein WBM86_03140 [Waterburya sp.]
MTFSSAINQKKSNQVFLTFLRIAMALILLGSINACNSVTQNTSSSSVRAEDSTKALNSTKPVKYIPIEKQLEGRWEAKFEENTLVFVFTSDKKVIMWEVGDKQVSNYGKYTIDTHGYTTVLNVNIKDKVLALGAIKFSSEEILRYQRSYGNGLPNNIYAFKSFNKNAILFQKITDSDKLPSNLGVKTF